MTTILQLEVSDDLACALLDVSKRFGVTWPEMYAYLLKVKRDLSA